MTQMVSQSQQQAATLEQVLIQGDLSKLSPEQRVAHMKSVCDSLGLNHLTKPFEYIPLNGKLTLYAKRDATDQLRNLRKVSVKIKSREVVDDVYVVTAEATMPDGRVDESIGAVSLGTLKGEFRANAIMKAETKAKRRVTLSICGLGFLDETEVDGPLTHEPQATQSQQVELPKDLGEYVIQVGKKFRGQKLKDVPPKDLFSFCNWLVDQSSQKQERLNGFAAEFVEVTQRYLEEISQNQFSGPS